LPELQGTEDWVKSAVLPPPFSLLTVCVKQRKLDTSIYTARVAMHRQKMTFFGDGNYTFRTDFIAAIQTLNSNNLANLKQKSKKL
jgi:hypothetical protein